MFWWISALVERAVALTGLTRAPPPTEAQTSATASSSRGGDLTFPFLSLPTDIRLLIYDAVGFTHHRYILPNIGPEGSIRWKGSGVVDETITLIRPVFSFDLFATCRQINAEARPIYGKKLQELVSQPVRFHLGYGALSAITPQPPSSATDSPLIHCLNVKKERNHQPSDDQDMDHFLGRSSNFLQHCQAATGKGHVEFVVDTFEVFSGVHHVHGIEQAVEGAWNLGKGDYLPEGTQLDITFIYHKQFPDSQQKDSRIKSGVELELMYRQSYGEASDNFRFRKVESEESWARMRKGGE